MWAGSAVPMSPPPEGGATSCGHGRDNARRQPWLPSWVCATALYPYDRGKGKGKGAAGKGEGDDEGKGKGKGSGGGKGKGGRGGAQPYSHPPWRSRDAYD